jgi:hypothetical protein
MIIKTQNWILMLGDDRKDLGIMFTIQEMRKLEEVLKDLPTPPYFVNAWWQVINKKDFDIKNDN